MLEYKLDVSEKSHAHVFNVDENARLFSLYATEIGHYHANPAISQEGMAKCPRFFCIPAPDRA